MPTQHGLPVEEKKRFVERAKRFYEDELIDQLIEDHKGNMVAIDGRTLQYEVALNESGARQQLERKCDKPVIYLARVGFDYHYYVPLPRRYYRVTSNDSRQSKRRIPTDRQHPIAP